MEGFALHRMQSLAQRKLVLCLRTQALAEQVAARLDEHARRLDLSFAVARVGWDRNRWVDHFQKAVGERAAENCTVLMSLLNLLDRKISLANGNCERADHIIVALLRIRCLL